MILLNDNDLCLISGGKDSTEVTKNLKKSKQECKQDIWSACKEFFWDGCTIIAETGKWVTSLSVAVCAVGYCFGTAGLMPDFLRKMMDQATKIPEQLVPIDL